MKYSVWNVGTAAFDYYETPEVATSSNTPKPGHLKPRTLGATVEQACWPLPPGAKLIGSGEVAIGKIAIHPSAALGATPSDGSLAKGLLLAVAGALAVKVLLPRGRRR